MISNNVAQVTATRGGNARNNNAPDYTVPPEQKKVGSVYRVNPLGKRFKDGTDEKITDLKWKELDGIILGLTNGDVHALCDEDITYPHDYAVLDADTLDAVLVNLKKAGHLLKAHTQKMVKYWRSFAHFLESTGRCIREEYFTKDAILSCGIQLRALEDSKDSKDALTKLPKLTDLTDPLAWFDAAIKVFAQLIGDKNLPLGYIVRHEVDVEPDPRDDNSRIIPGKCYSRKHGLLQNKLIARRTHNDGVYNNNNVVVYNHMITALSGTSYESILKEHATTKDGCAIWLALIANHGGEERWEKSYAQFLKGLSRSWKSFATVTLGTHIGNLKIIFDPMDLACKYTSHTPLTQREKVLHLLDSLDNNDPDVIATIANIWADLPGVGSDFQACCSLLIPVDPIEAKITKSGSKRSFDAMVSATLLSGRGSTGVDLCWYPNAKFKALPQNQKDELQKWRKTPEGVAALKDSKKKHRIEMAKAKLAKQAKQNKSNGGRGNGKGNNDAKKEKWDKAVKKTAVLMVKIAAKERAAELAKRHEDAREIASILKEEQQPADGGAKVAAAKKGAITFAAFDQREAALCSILGKLDAKDFKLFKSNKKSRS